MQRFSSPLLASGSAAPQFFTPWYNPATPPTLWQATAILGQDFPELWLVAPLRRKELPLRTNLSPASFNLFRSRLNLFRSGARNFRSGGSRARRQKPKSKPFKGFSRAEKPLSAAGKVTTRSRFLSLARRRCRISQPSFLSHGLS
jgi:hypothetical protein